MKHESRNPKSDAGAVGQVFNLPSIARQVKNLPHGTPPCSCAGPNADCTRSGLPMLGRLYEICAGINCSHQMSEHYRRLWDARQTPPCKHLGAASGKAIQCPTCAARDLDQDLLVRPPRDLHHADRAARAVLLRHLPGPHRAAIGSRPSATG